MLNYFFFVGQAVFLLLYFLCRLPCREFRVTPRVFFGLAFETVLGCMGGLVLFLPGILAVLGNPRVDNFLFGQNLLFYGETQRYGGLLSSLFFMPEVPSRPNFFPQEWAKWSSMSAWLPVFGCSGAIAYFQSRKHSDWLRRMLIICFFCAIIPGLNAMFQLFNWVYYARWYYMMVLILVLATVACFEQAESQPVEWKRAFGWTFGITAAFALFIGFMPKSWNPDKETGKITYGLMKHVDRFWIYVAIAVVSLVLAWQMCIRDR